MARDLTTGMVIAMTSKVVRPCFIVEIDTAAGIILAWSGIGTLSWNGKGYVGVGVFGGIDVVGESTDLKAVGVNFSLDGVDSAMLSVALQDIQQGKIATLWLGALDSSGTLIADPYQLFSGFTDVPTINEGPDSSCTIAISVENRAIDLGRARERRYTSADQQIDYPGDEGFDYVPSLQNAVIRFG